MNRKNKYHTAKAVTLDANGREVPDGWDLFCTAPGSTRHEWCNRFPLRRDAFKAKRILEGEAPK